MKRLVCLLTVLGVAGLACTGKAAAEMSGGTAVAPDSAGGSPNILLIVADDLTFSDLSLAGAEIQTPNIDQLAREGTLFRRFYTGPTCAPTRAMLLTGVDAHDTGFGLQGGVDYELPPGFENDPAYRGYLSPDVETVASRLQKNGYFTFMAGKWHLGIGSDEGPADRGFKRSLSMPYGGASHFDQRGYSPAHPRATLRLDGQPIEFPEGFYSTDYYTDALVGFIEQAAARKAPFFGYAAYTAPHWPLMAPAATINKYEATYQAGWDEIRQERFRAQQDLGFIPAGLELPNRWAGVPAWSSLSSDDQAVEAKVMATYAAMVDRLDASIGRLFEALDRTGLRDNTIVVFMSDNGAAAEDFSRLPPGSPVREWIDRTYPRHDLASVGGPNNWSALGRAWAQVGSVHFNLYKSTLYEGGVRSPLIIMDPRDRQARGKIETRPWHVTGIAPSMLEWAGIPATTADESDGAPQMGASLAALQAGNDLPAIAYEALGSSMVIAGDWKLVRQGLPSGDGQWQLFNLLVDPAEQNDVASRQPQIVDKLVQDFAAYSRRVKVRELPEGWNPLVRVLGGPENTPRSKVLQ